MAAAFSEAAVLVTGGCSTEMPLYAMEHALSMEYHNAIGGPNYGFIRPNSLVMVIILTYEDDCSTKEAY